ncbi:hypothetical protein ACLB2K_031455 [Fragaria x ananassa]
MGSTSLSSNGGMSGRNFLGFTVHVVTGRWFSVFASFLIMAGVSATYLFGAYSKVIKATLGYSQTDLNMLGFSKDVGANVGIVAGLLTEVTPVWFGLLIGATMNFVGYFMIWLAVTGRIAKPKVWHMCLYIFIGTNSQNFANTGALVTCVKNFPESRGSMIGLLKGYIGLGAAILTHIYLAIYGNDEKSLILLIAWLPAAISVVFLYSIRPMKVIRQPNELTVFYHFLYTSILLACYLLAISVLQKWVSFSQAAYAGSATVTICLLFFPLGIAIREELALWNQMKQPIDPPSAVKEEKSEEVKQEEIEDTGCLANICSRPPRGEDYTILQALLSLDMFILFIATVCGLGSSLTAIDNLGQVGESLGYPTKTVSTFVSLVSIWSFFGRVFAGFYSESLLVRYNIPRPLVLAFSLLLSCAGLLLIAFPTSGSVYAASIIIGFSFGCQMPLLFAIISELFGLKRFATLSNCVQVAMPLGSYLLNVQLAGKMYDQEATKELAKIGLKRSQVKELICHGKNCYMLSFATLAAVTFFGVLISLLLVYRTREFYKGDIYKYREEAETIGENKSS